MLDYEYEVSASGCSVSGNWIQYFCAVCEDCSCWYTDLLRHIAVSGQVTNPLTQVTTLTQLYRDP